MDKTNAAYLASGVLAILTNVIRAQKAQNSLLFNKSYQNLANTDVTKAALNGTASL